MAEPAAFKYRAFISYSHADSSWAKWLHRGLERFRIDKDLVGRKTATGTIPKWLRHYKLAAVQSGKITLGLTLEQLAQRLRCVECSAPVLSVNP